MVAYPVPVDTSSRVIFLEALHSSGLFDLIFPRRYFHLNLSSHSEFEAGRGEERVSFPRFRHVAPRQAQPPVALHSHMRAARRADTPVGPDDSNVLFRWAQLCLPSFPRGPGALLWLSAHPTSPPSSSSIPSLEEGPTHLGPAVPPWLVFPPGLGAPALGGLRGSSWSHLGCCSSEILGAKVQMWLFRRITLSFHWAL